MPGCALGLGNEPDTALLLESSSPGWETRHKQIIASQCDACSDRGPQGSAFSSFSLKHIFVAILEGVEKGQGALKDE